MNDAEFMCSTDPATMIRHLRFHCVDTGNRLVGFPVIAETPRKSPLATDRQLRAWVEACRAAVGWDVGSGCNLDQSEGLRLAVEAWQSDSIEELSRRDRAALLRCVVGIPGRHFAVFGEKPFTTVDDLIRDAKLYAEQSTPDVLAVAAAIRRDGTFGDLPILADALEDGGCPEYEPETTTPSRIFVNRSDAGWYVLAGNQTSRHHGRRHAIRFAEREFRVKRWTSMRGGKRSSPNERGCFGDGLIVEPVRPNSLLAHLRSSEPHCRSCHALAAVLGDAGES